MCIVWTHFVFPVARLSWIISLTVIGQIYCPTNTNGVLKQRPQGHQMENFQSCLYLLLKLLTPPWHVISNSHNTTATDGWSEKHRSSGYDTIDRLKPRVLAFTWSSFHVPADQTYAPVTTTHAVLAFTDVKGLLAVHISNIITDRLLPSLKFYKNDISASVLELLCETFSKLLFIVDDSPSHFGQSRSAGIS